jgi:superfamily II DNA or RNA helicase
VLRHASGPASRLAGFYLSAFTKRRAVLAGAVQKLKRLRQLAPAVRAADRTIVFTQTQDAAKRAVSVLRETGIGGAVLDSTMDISDQESVFAAFEDGTHELIAAPKLLDEGVDVPSADLALVLASSRSKRQMIQRMGRVIRPNADGRIARIAIFFVENSSEDPETGTHNGSADRTQPAGYGVRVSVDDRKRIFKPTWSEVTIQISAHRVSVPLSPGFWRKCPELRSAEIGRWLLQEGLAPWPRGHPPPLRLEPLGGRIFKLSC